MIASQALYPTFPPTLYVGCPKMSMDAARECDRVKCSLGLGLVDVAALY